MRVRFGRIVSVRDEEFPDLLAEEAFQTFFISAPFPPPGEVKPFFIFGAIEPCVSQVYSGSLGRISQCSSSARQMISVASENAKKRRCWIGKVKLKASGREIDLDRRGRLVDENGLIWPRV